MGLIFSPGPTPNTVITPEGKIITVPLNWILLPPGDAALTRRVKAMGEHWVVAEKKGRRVFSKGIWASNEIVEKIRNDLKVERSTESFAKRKVADSKRREKVQDDYVDDFQEALLSYLAFHPTHANLALTLAQAVTKHATPVGSGTVARTKRIPIEKRVEAAVIAWMRHQTTAYDDMPIPRVKGQRREVRKMLARRSHGLLEWYRKNENVANNCPLIKAL